MVIVNVGRLLWKQCPLFISMGTTADIKSTITPVEQILSSKMLFFNTVPTISCAFSAVMNKSLHAAPIRVAAVEVTQCCCHCCWNAAPTASLGCIRCWYPETFIECQWMSVGAIFCMGRIQFQPSASCALPCHSPFFQGCPSAAVCHRATKSDGILEGRLSPQCHPTSVCLWRCGPTSKHRKHYFQSSPCKVIV